MIDEVKRRTEVRCIVKDATGPSLKKAISFGFLLAWHAIESDNVITQLRDGVRDAVLIFHHSALDLKILAAFGQRPNMIQNRKYLHSCFRLFLTS
jgi:hypothetical protein